jgi:hypothetical protein
MEEVLGTEYLQTEKFIRSCNDSIYDITTRNADLVCFMDTSIDTNNGSAVTKDKYYNNVNDISEILENVEVKEMMIHSLTFHG